MPYANKTDVFEIQGTRRELYYNFGNSLPTASVSLLVASEDAHAAIKEIMGGPLKYPIADALKLFPLWAASVELSTDLSEYEQLITDPQVINYLGTVVLKVDYSGRLGSYYKSKKEEDAEKEAEEEDPDNPDNPVAYNYYVEDDLEPRVEYHPIDARKVCWNDKDKTPLSPEETPIRLEPGNTLTHTVVGFVKFKDYWLELIGTVADQSYYSQNTETFFYSKTLLLRSMTANLEYSHRSYETGKPTWTLVCRYEAKEIGWNKFWKLGYTSTGATASGDYFEIIDRDNSGPPLEIFPYRDHSDILF